MTIRSLAIVVLVLSQSVQPVTAKEGFGSPKKVVSLMRRNPSAVLILGTKVGIKVTATSAKNRNLALQLESQLGSELVEHDRRLILEEKKPQTLIQVDLLQCDYTDRWETRTERTVRDVGDKDDKKPVLHEDLVQVKYHLVGLRFKIAYKVTEVAGKKGLYADSIEVPFREEYREGKYALNQAELEANAIRTAVAQMVAKLAPTLEELYVLLPQGKLKDLSNYAEGGLWSRYAEALEGMPPFPKPVDDSYRQYGLGLAYEAMSYSADDVETTLRYLERAAESYNDAINNNPKEDYLFKPHETALVVQGWHKVENVLRRENDPIKKVTSPPLDRVNSSLAKYRTLVSQQETREAASGRSEASKSAAAKGDAGMTNKDVIEMARGGVDEELILGAISDAERCKFDLSSKGLVELSKGRVTKSVIKALQEKNCP